MQQTSPTLALGAYKYRLKEIHLSNYVKINLYYVEN